ncbi:MAG TPA: hypothetical protein VM925_05350 [Labilithrix sp.]|jgi:predicted anti-sigma-YlaC factor YlaD|nr:hypothetical protein [Labilithrix sp.]
MVVTCAELAASLVELEEGGASCLRRASVRFHLSICERCRRYVAQLEELRRDLSRLREGPPLATSSLERALVSFRAGSGPDEPHGR